MPHDNPNDPHGHELWPDFERFAAEQGVELDTEPHEWRYSWDCFLAGAAAQFRFDMVGE